MSEFKPCPFCGKADALELINFNEMNGYKKGEDAYSLTPNHTIVCNKLIGGCGATGGYRSCPEEAIDQWNTRPTVGLNLMYGEWFLLDECSNAGVYCSVCHKAVFRDSAWYKNVHARSKFCPNCGAKMSTK